MKKRTTKQEQRNELRTTLSKDFLVAMIAKTARISSDTLGVEEVERQRKQNVLGAILYADVLLKELEEN